MENLENSASEELQDNQPQTVEITEHQMQSFLTKLKAEERLPLGIIAGIISCILSTVIWAAVTYFSGYQIGYMAIGVGFLVGYAIRIAGNGISLIYAIMGALFSLIGCALGNLLAIFGFFANEEGIGFGAVLSNLDLSALPQIFVDMTLSSPMDFVFYGLAAFIGWSAAKREVKEEELAEYFNP